MLAENRINYKYCLKQFFIGEKMKICDMQVGEHYSCESCGFELEVVTPCDHCEEGNVSCPCCGENLQLQS